MLSNDLSTAPKMPLQFKLRLLWNRAQILQDGSSQRNVAAAFDVSQSVVSRLWKRFQTTGGYVRRPGQGKGVWSVKIWQLQNMDS